MNKLFPYLCGNERIFMRIKEGFVLREILGEHVVSGEGLAQVNYSKLISLNDTAAFLWKAVEGKEFTEETLRDALLDEYEVEADRAAADVARLVSRWKEMGLIEEG